MSKDYADTRRSMVLGIGAYGCAHAALFSLVGLHDLPMPAVFWALGALPLGWAASSWMTRCGYKNLADLVGIQTVAFCASVLGMHAQQLQCFLRLL